MVKWWVLGHSGPYRGPFRFEIRQPVAEGGFKIWKALYREPSHVEGRDPFLKKQNFKKEKKKKGTYDLWK
jgi:hypothetical protein